MLGEHMEELISKKELLTLTGISYGQLYRWKRKNIIPEEWFIKKSVPSGQETFFPKDKILERIDVIVNMKDEASLDDLAKMFSPDMVEDNIDIAKLIKTNLLTQESINHYKQALGLTNVEGMHEIVGARLFKNQVMTGEITLEEGKLLASYVHKNFDSLVVETARIYLFRNMGVPFVIGSKDAQNLVFDENYKKILEVNLYEEVSTIKFQIMN